MPWNNHDYPPSMKHLDTAVRHKAIEIANALLDDGYEEGRAISIATKQAEDYVETHHNGNEPYEVKPHGDGWQVIKKGNDRASYVSEKKKDAVEKARELSGKHKTTFVQYKQDGTKQSS
ncbi:DUF2188 domain-containing protein [Bacillus sp. 1P06AnD]|uniref:DUF2188 domain-containing protein n=1 Tax=Bacillus sp. 1P06AnD TaxID=3132208 RepID=UPI0039A365A8